jgi:hypothetical protein
LAASRRGDVNVMIRTTLFPPSSGTGALAPTKERLHMSTKGFSGRAALVGLSGLMVLTLAAASADAAGPARRAGAARAPRGDYTHHVQGTRTANGHTRQDAWTNAKGKTATRDATVVNDRESGTRTRDVNWQGPNGKTATREDVTQRTADGYTRDSTVTGPNGKTATRDATVVRDKDAGTVSRDVVSTGPNGKTRTVNDDVQRTDDGYTRETVRTNANGGTLSRDVTAMYDPATKTFSKDVSVDRERPDSNAKP